MSTDTTISQWYRRLSAGDDSAAAPIWDHFLSRLLNLSRARLGAANRTTYDEEDVMVSVFRSFCQGLRRGQFPVDLDRERLWVLLATIAFRKCLNRQRYQNQKKRSAGNRGNTPPAKVEDLASREPSPELQLEFKEQLGYLLNCLQHDDLRQIALMKLEGYTNEQIAQQLTRSLSTIERKLSTIRALWKQWAAS